MNKKVISLLAAGVISVGLHGQAEKQNPDKSGSKEMTQTVTGCLTEASGSYTMDLSKHKNHTVKITGTTSDQGGKKMMNVSKIEHVAPSCREVPQHRCPEWPLFRSAHDKAQKKGARRRSRSPDSEFNFLFDYTARRPPIRLIRKITRKTKNKIFAIPAAVEAIIPKPKSPAIKAINKKIHV